MLSTISTLLGQVHLGEPVSDAGLTLIPVFGESPVAPEFVTLAQALANEALLITEVDAGGSVPELRAANLSKAGLLILDGEEVAGAKQNRVLNTSVYLAPHTEVTVPVSCTERGRWSYVSDRFEDSGYVAAQKVRSVAHESVTSNVRVGKHYASNQGAVWSEVEKLHGRHKVATRTHAMRDVYESRGAEIKRRREAFKLQPQQTGVFALWGGRVVGFDAIAKPDAYERLHDRLVGSYALDSLDLVGDDGTDDLRIAKEFLVSLADATESVHDSPGGGVSHRFTGPGFTGSVLTVDDAILHAVFFATGE